MTILVLLLLISIAFSIYSFRYEIINLSFNKKISLLGSIGLIITILISVLTYYQNKISIKATIQNDEIANELSKLLVDNSNRDLDLSKKKLSFDIINTLYKDFYQFDEHNALVIRKLKGNDFIQDEFYLGLYLNGFEDLYEQCKRGLISREDIRMNFLHLIGTTCNNSQVDKVVGNSGNGLKLLCNSFYPNSKLANKAKTEKESCK